MNNWDVRPRLKVVMLAGDVPEFVSGEVLQYLMGYRPWESTLISYSGDKEDRQYAVVSMVDNKEVLEEDHMDMVVSCLDDHINNTGMDTSEAGWLSHQYALLVDEEEWLWVDIAYGIYHGPNCMVDVYYVTI